MASKVSGYIGKINPGNGTQYSLGSTAYGYCETAAATAAKTVDMTGFILTEGATIFIKFKYNNTATDDPTLNVQSTGAKPLIPKTWYAGAILSLTYDGTSWIQANAYLDASVITSGTLPTARGGTGATSYRINSVIVGSATPTETGGTVASQLTWVQSKSGALYSTGTNEPTQFGTLPVAQGGTGSTSYAANRVIYSESTTKLSASGHYASSSKLAINSTSAPTENCYINGTTGLNGATSHKAGHIYLEGSQASSSTGNTTQIVFGTSSSQHIALSSNSGAFIINPTTSSTTGQIVLKPGATSYISSGRLTINAAGNDSYNLYVNGTMLVHRDTTTTADLPAGINFSVKDTTTDQTYSGGGIFAYHDHHASSTYGVNMVIKSGGAMIIGGGEGPSSLYNVLHNAAVTNNNGNLNTEASYFVTDGTTYIYSNANSIADRIGISLSTGGHILPQKAEAANDNVQNLGASNNRWANIYSAYTHSSTFYFGVPSFGGESRAMLVYSPTYPNHGIWYFDEASDTMTLDVHGKANSKTEADLAIGALGAGIISTRNRYIPHTNNTTGTVGTQYIPVYVNAGTITQITANSVLTNLGSTTAASTYAASPRPGVTGTLPIANGGTGATTAAAARANLGALGAITANGYDGMANMAGVTNTYIRTTQNGIIPYQSGGAGSGHSNIGTSTWRFANVYTDKINGLSVPQMEIISYTGNDTLSMSIAFSFAPDIIIALDSSTLDNTTGIADVTAGPQICDMSKVTTSWQGVHFGVQSIGVSFYRSTAAAVVVCSKSSNGKTYYLKVDTTLVNTLPQAMKDTWGAGTTLRIGEKAVYNQSGVVTRFLGIKI